MNPNDEPDQDHRPALLRDFLIFQLKLLIDGAKDAVLIPVSIAAVAADLIRGHRRRPALFYRVLDLSERFDLWLNVHAAASGAEHDADGMFGTSEAGSPTFVGKLEQLVRGGDAPRRSPR
ncbi:MAG TPA: hypothetical protein VJ957_11080 [Longimicrobiales bacterium]|nr:hypothetical protein [Longimicrobiales bacterium]